MILMDLTTREVGILRLFVAGCINKAIASEILISEKPVGFHLDNIYKKLARRRAS